LMGAVADRRSFGRARDDPVVGDVQPGAFVFARTSSCKRAAIFRFAAEKGRSVS